MLDERDCTEMSNLMVELFNNKIVPQFDSINNEIHAINEKLIPVSRVEELEHEMKFVKMILQQLSKDIQQLKEA